jgi:teichuronic acid biosynthesis glycosyltransferase TuaC
MAETLWWCTGESCAVNSNRMRVLWPHNFDHINRPEGGMWIGTRTSGCALSAAGVHPQHLYLGNLRKPVQLWRARAELSLHARGVDILHAQYGSACAMVCVGIGDCPRIVSLRGSDWTRAHSEHYAGRAHSLIAVGLSRIAIPHYDAIVCMSHRMASEVQGFFPHKRVQVLPSPIDLSVFKPRHRSDARRELGLADDGERYVLFSSATNHNALKRKWLAEAAVAWAHSHIPKIRLVTATGYSRAEMPTLISAADVVICTSTSEGWPNFIKEALACNVPFVSTEVSDLPLIASREPTCRVTPADADLLGAAICDVLSQPPPMNLRCYVAHMSTTAHAEQLIALYRSLM